MVADSGETLIEKVDAIDDGGYHTTLTPPYLQIQEDYTSIHMQLLMKGIKDCGLSVCNCHERWCRTWLL